MRRETNRHDHRVRGEVSRQQILAIVALVLTGVAVTIILARLRGPSAAAGDVAVREHVLFQCIVDDHVQTFPIREWLKNKKEWSRAKDGVRKIGSFGEITCPKCKQLTAFKARKCPRCSELFRTALRSEEVELKMSPRELSCGKCGWNEAEKFREEKGIVVRKRTRKRAVVKPTPTPTPAPTLPPLKGPAPTLRPVRTRPPRSF
jgi:phage FluMu protein Com